MGWKARVMSFRYNSDIASNMSAASLIHANDLLFHLEKALDKSDVSLPRLVDCDGAKSLLRI